MCPFCVREEALLKRMGVTSFEKVLIDLDADLRDAMMARTSRRTVPLFFIVDLHVGGYDELYELEHAGKLDPLLRGELP
jgi:glutaredoxin 3